MDGFITLGDGFSVHRGRRKLERRVGRRGPASRSGSARMASSFRTRSFFQPMWTPTFPSVMDASLHGWPSATAIPSFSIASSIRMAFRSFVDSFGAHVYRCQRRTDAWAKLNWSKRPTSARRRQSFRALAGAPTNRSAFRMEWRSSRRNMPRFGTASCTTPRLRMHPTRAADAFDLLLPRRHSRMGRHWLQLSCRQVRQHLPGARRWPGRHRQSLDGAQRRRGRCLPDRQSSDRSNRPRRRSAAWSRFLSFALRGLDPLGFSDSWDLIDLPTICGHRDVNDTTCPGDFAYDDLAAIRNCGGPNTGQPSAGPPGGFVVGDVVAIATDDGSPLNLALCSRHGKQH